MSLSLFCAEYCFADTWYAGKVVGMVGGRKFPVNYCAGSRERLKVLHTHYSCEIGKSKFA